MSASSSLADGRAVAAQVVGIGVGQHHADQLEGRDAARKVVDAAVVFQVAVVDDDDALAQRGHIGHVVAGEQDGGAGAAVVFAQEFADAHLGGDIQPDGGFIEEQHLGAVQQPGGQLALHALAQRQVAHRFLEQRPQLQQLIQFLERGLVFGLRQAVDGLVEQERIGGGDIPAQAVALAHHQGHQPV